MRGHYVEVCLFRAKLFCNSVDSHSISLRGLFGSLRLLLDVFSTSPRQLTAAELLAVSGRNLALLGARSGLISSTSGLFRAHFERFQVSFFRAESISERIRAIRMDFRTKSSGNVCRFGAYFGAPGAFRAHFERFRAVPN